MSEQNAEVKVETEARFAATQEERCQTRDYLNSGDILSADTPERVEKRKTRLLADQTLTPTLAQEDRNILSGQPVRDAPRDVQRAFERQIGGNETQPCWFLTRGAELRRTVGRIHIRMRDAGRPLGYGTGFLVAPNLLLTNQHVLDSLATARFSRVEFDYEETFEGEILPTAVFDLAPDVFFVSHPAVRGKDYALVAVRSHARADCDRPGTELLEFGSNRLIREEGKLLKGELINSIHHPEGQPRQVSLRENRLMALEDTALQDLWMHYETDTEQGSSGAPLYNNQWEVVGIHHMAVEKRDSAGNILAMGGGIWIPEMGERQKWWYANEGLRISRFINDVEAQVQDPGNPDTSPAAERIVTDTGLALFETMLKPPTVSAAVPPAALGGTTPPAHRGFRPE